MIAFLEWLRILVPLHTPTTDFVRVVDYRQAFGEWYALERIYEVRDGLLVRR